MSGWKKSSSICSPIRNDGEKTAEPAPDGAGSVSFLAVRFRDSGSGLDLCAAGEGAAPRQQHLRLLAVAGADLPVVVQGALQRDGGGQVKGAVVVKLSAELAGDYG